MSCTLSISITTQKSETIIHFGSVTRLLVRTFLLPPPPRRRQTARPAEHGTLTKASASRPEVRETAMNNMSVPHSVIHSSNFTNPDDAEDGGRKKDSGDVPKPKVSEREKVGHDRKCLMK